MGPADSAVERPGGGAAALAPVLQPSFLRKLDRVQLTVRRSLSTRPGNTPMPRGAQGSGIELERYKTYGAGDDLRYLDWNAYGRLDQLLIKTFRAEREAPLQLFVDASASMALPAADDKLGFSVALAASLAYVSLRHGDPVRVVALGGALPAGHAASPFFRHRDDLPRLCAFLQGLQARGATTLAPGTAAALCQRCPPGMAIVLSDFLVPPETYEAALGELAARRFTVAALRVLGVAERDPSRLFRRGRIIDAESGRHRFITLGRDNLARYRNALADHLERLRVFCHRCGVAFSVADTAAGIERCVFHDLPALGLLH